MYLKFILFLSSFNVETHSATFFFSIDKCFGFLFLVEAPTPRHHWTPTEKGALKKLFRRTIIQGKTPCQLECPNAIKKSHAWQNFHGSRPNLQ